MSRFAIRRGLVLVLAALAPGGPAHAQDAAPPPIEDPRAPKYKDVERGFFVGFEAGWLGLLKTPNQDPVKFPFATEGGGTRGGRGRRHAPRVRPHRPARRGPLRRGGQPEGQRLLRRLRPAGGGARPPLRLLRPEGPERLRAVLPLRPRARRLPRSPTRPASSPTPTCWSAAASAPSTSRSSATSRSGCRSTGLYVLSAKAPGFAVTPVVRYTF